MDAVLDAAITLYRHEAVWRLMCVNKNMAELVFADGNTEPNTRVLGNLQSKDYTFFKNEYQAPEMTLYRRY